MKKHKIFANRLFGLLVLMAVLQAVAVGLIIRFGRDILTQEKTVLDLTSTMTTETLPGIRNDLGEVNQKADDIRGDVYGLRNQVSKVDQRLGDVHQGVEGVGNQVEGLRRNVTGFVQDKSGLIWGHSLNPYILTGLLFYIAAGVSLWVWFAHKNRRAPLNNAVYTHDARDAFSERLDQLTVLVEQIRTQDCRYPTSPKLQQLMHDTERLIDDARSDLALLSDRCKPQGDDPEDNRTIH